MRYMREFEIRIDIWSDQKSFSAHEALAGPYVIQFWILFSTYEVGIPVSRVQAQHHDTPFRKNICLNSREIYARF